MEYFYRMERDGDGWLVTFRSLPEAITGGSTMDEAVRNAADAAEVVLLTYAKDGRDIPPSDRKMKPGDTGSVIAAASVVAKISFMEAFRKAGMSRVEFARRLGKNESEVRRMLDPYHHTKLGALEDAMRILGKRFVISVRDEPAIKNAAA
jgi:antitoxin HicB